MVALGPLALHLHTCMQRPFCFVLLHWMIGVTFMLIVTNFLLEVFFIDARAVGDVAIVYSAYR